MKIIEEPITAAAELAHIPIAFEVESVFDVSALDGGRLTTDDKGKATNKS